MAITIQRQRETPLTYATLVPIVAGAAIASGGEPRLSLLGVALCLTSTALRSLKSVVQSMLMSDASEKLDPMSLLLYMSATSMAMLLPSLGFIEPGALRAAAALAASRPGFVYWLLANSCLAYALNLTNFLVTKYTSALTLQVLGNAKGVVAAAVSVAVFRNRVTLQGATGYGILLTGVYGYSEAKKRGKRLAAAAAGAAAAAAGDVEGGEAKEHGPPGHGHGHGPADKERDREASGHGASGVGVGVGVGAQLTARRALAAGGMHGVSPGRE